METKKWWTSKTYLLAVLTITLGIVEFLLGLPATASVGTIIVGILGIIIRNLTNQPISGTPGARPK